MRVLIHASDIEMERALADAAHEAHFDVEALPVLSEFRTALFRDLTAVGVLWTTSPEFGWLTVKEFRTDHIASPIMVLIDHDDMCTDDLRVAHYVLTLGMGADDVQRAPIDEREFVARLAAIGRRERAFYDVIQLPNDVIYHPDLGEVIFRSGIVRLTKKERDLFNTLTARPNTAFTKEMLLDAVYGGRDEPAAKILDVFVHKIRRKLHRPLGGMDVIETVWGRGYRFKPDGYLPQFSGLNARMIG